MTWTLVEQIIIGTQWVFTEPVTGSFFRIKYLQLAQSPQLLIAQAEQLEDGSYQIWNPLVKMLAQGQAETLRLDKPEAFNSRVLGFRKQNTQSSNMTVEVYVSDVVPSVTGGVDYTQQFSTIESELDLISDSIDSLPASIDYTQRFVELDAHLTAIGASIAALPVPVDYSQQLSEIRSDIAALSTQVANLGSGSSGGTTPPSTGDTYFSNVVVLMHFNNDFLDVKGHTINNNNVVNSATQKEFGDTSAYFNGTDSYLQIPKSICDLTVEKWTFESFVFSSDSRGGRIVFSNYNLPSGGQSNCLLIFNNYAGTDALGFSFTPPIDRWYHYAVVKDGSTVYAFIDGVMQGSINIPNWNSSANNYIGGSPGDNNFGNRWFQFYIDELRITLGVARYTSNFTPPTAPFPNS